MAGDLIESVTHRSLDEHVIEEACSRSFGRPWNESAGFLICMCVCVCVYMRVSVSVRV